MQDMSIDFEILILLNRKYKANYEKKNRSILLIFHPASLKNKLFIHSIVCTKLEHNRPIELDTNCLQQDFPIHIFEQI